jgi:IS5 family transposase
MIDPRRAQLSFGDRLIAEEVDGLYEDWMVHADTVLADESIVMAAYEALAKRHRLSRTRGRRGYCAEVVVRLLVLKHARNWSYAVLEREVRANLIYRQFTRIGMAKMADAKTMGKWGVAVGPEVIKQIHDRVVSIAKEKGLAQGAKMRIDTTVVETNIHYPTDSSLLGDGVRALTRVMKKITKIAGEVGCKLRDRSRSVKHRVMEIGRAARAKGPQGKAKLHKAYANLLNSTSRVVGQAKRFAREILDGTRSAMSSGGQVALECFRGEIEQMVPRVRQVIAQTRARIFHGETRSEGKIFSLFEPSTEIIRKGKAGKPNEFGKLVKLQEVENQIVIDYEVYDRRPNDTTLLIPAIERHEAVLGTPRLVAADAGFYSAKNEAAAKAKGVKRVCIPNRSTKSATRRREQKKRWFRNGQKWRTRVRGTHQRGQAATWAQPLPLQRRRGDEALGRSRRHRRQSDQHGQ